MTLEELEKRIQVLEDIEEIKKLQIQYVNSLTQAKWDDVISCFSDDAVVDIHAGYCKGKAEFSKLFKEIVGLTHIGQEGNFVVHPTISVSGDTAKGSWLLYLQFSQPRTLNPRPTILASDQAPDWMQGYYEMEYERVDGKWKISLLKWRCRLITPRSLLIDYKDE
jgi:ketosteroid isomerase-like protein